MLRPNQEDFIQKLESEVLFQSRLEQKKVLPEKWSNLGRLIASYPWQVILIVAGATALIKILMTL